MSFSCRLSLNSIGMHIIANARERGFKCTKAHYLPLYRLERIMSNSRHYVKRSIDMIKTYKYRE